MADVCADEALERLMDLHTKKATKESLPESLQTLGAWVSASKTYTVRKEGSIVRSGSVPVKLLFDTFLPKPEARD